MTTFSRRNFVSLISLGVLGLKFLPFSLTSLSDKRKLQDIPSLLKSAADYRKEGKLTEALTVYHEVISIKSDEIRAYDGIRKVYLQSKYKELDVLELYLEGLSKNPSHILFKERIAKEYIRLGLGNKKFAQTIGNNLLEDAKDIFEELVIEEPENIQFVAQESKVNRKINQKAHSTDARDNFDIKLYKQQNRQSYKERFTSVDETIIKSKLQLMLNKPVSQDRDKQIKHIYIMLIRKYSAIGKREELAEKIYELYNFDPQDTNSLYIIRRFCKKNLLYNVMRILETQNYQWKNNFWSGISLSKSLIWDNATGEARIVIDNIKKSARFYYQNFEVGALQISLAIKENNWAEAKDRIQNLGDYILGISSAHYIDRFNMLCVNYFIKKAEDANALNVVNIALGIDNKVYDEVILKKVTDINKHKVIEKSIHIERLEKFKMSLTN